MPEKLTSDLKDLLGSLNKWQAQYLIIGAHALGVYTEPRGTKDLDIWDNPTPCPRHAEQLLIISFLYWLSSFPSLTSVQRSDLL